MNEMAARDADEPETRRDPRIAAARLWWQNLQPLRSDGRPNPNVDRGSLARLRRAASAADILDEEAVFGLHRRLGYGRANAERTLLPVAIAAAVLAQVRQDSRERRPARAAGRTSLADTKLETAILSPLRLRRLLQAREPDDVLRQMRRLVQLTGDPLDVGALAVLVLDWFDEERGASARMRFAYDYYAAAGDPPGAAPDPTSPSAEQASLS